MLWTLPAALRNRRALGWALLLFSLLAWMASVSQVTGDEAASYLRLVQSGWGKEFWFYEGAFCGGNHHLLSAAYVKLIAYWWPLSEGALRSLSVLSYGVLILVLAKIGGQTLAEAEQRPQSSNLVWTAILMAASYPGYFYQFQLARGYAPAIVLEAMALLCLIRFAERGGRSMFWGAHVCALLSALSIFSFLFFDAALILVLTAVRLQHDRGTYRSLSSRLGRGLAALGPPGALNIMVIAGYIYPVTVRVMACDEWIPKGSGFWSDTVGSLLSFVTGISQFPPVLEQGGKLLFALFVSFSLAVPLLLRRHAITITKPTRVVLAVLFTMALLSVAAHYGAGSAYPTVRGALFLPLAWFVYLFSLLKTPGLPSWMRRTIGLACLCFLTMMTGTNLQRYRLLSSVDVPRQTLTSIRERFPDTPLRLLVANVHHADQFEIQTWWFLQKQSGLDRLSISTYNDDDFYHLESIPGWCKYDLILTWDDQAADCRSRLGPEFAYKEVRIFTLPRKRDHTLVLLERQPLRGGYDAWACLGEGGRSR